MYVANADSGTVTVIDGTSNKMLDQTKVGIGPQSIAYNPSNGKMYVTNQGSNTISVIETGSYKVIKNITGIEAPVSITYNPSNYNMYVSNFKFPSSLFMIDSQTNNITKVLQLGGMPLSVFTNPQQGILYNPINNKIYTSGATNGSAVNKDILVIDPTANKISARIVAGFLPILFAYNPSDGNVYVVYSGSSHISVINSSTNVLIKNIHIVEERSSVAGIAYNPSNGKMYVSDLLKDYVYMIR
jgi:YVTN family beta-propeller protein